MSRVTLRYLTEEDEEEFYRAFQEDWKGWEFVFYWDTLGERNYKKWISLLPGFPEGKNLPEGHVKSSFLLAFNEEGKLVGRTSIRHELNDHLLKYGGNIGYGVCPSFRRQGYATEILKETLIHMRRELPSLEKGLVTCDDKNIGSIRTIEKNNGVLKDKIKQESGIITRRYWIEL